MKDSINTHLQFCTKPKYNNVPLTVLDLLAVTRSLLQGLNDEGSGRRHDRDDGLSVLDGQADGDLQTLPVSGRLGDVVTNLLGRLFIGSARKRDDKNGYVSMGATCLRN